jgi:hypothetical protein
MSSIEEIYARSVRRTIQTLDQPDFIAERVTSRMERDADRFERCAASIKKINKAGFSIGASGLEVKSTVAEYRRLSLELDDEEAEWAAARQARLSGHKPAPQLPQADNGIVPDYEVLRLLAQQAAAEWALHPGPRTQEALLDFTKKIIEDAIEAEYHFCVGPMIIKEFNKIRV